MDSPKATKADTTVEVKTKKLSEFKDEEKAKPAKDTLSDGKAEKITVKTTPKATPSPTPEPTPAATPIPEMPKPAEPTLPEVPAIPEPPKPEEKTDQPTEQTATTPTTGTNSSGEPSVHMQPTGFIFPKAPHMDGEPNPLKEQADAAKAELQDPKIFDTKEYHVPIKASRHNRKKSGMGSMIFWLILLLLLVAGVAGLIKVGIIHTSIKIPYINK